MPFVDAAISNTYGNCQDSTVEWPRKRPEKGEKGIQLLEYTHHPEELLARGPQQARHPSPKSPPERGTLKTKNKRNLHMRRAHARALSPRIFLLEKRLVAST